MIIDSATLLRSEGPVPLLLALATDTGVTAYSAWPEAVETGEAAEVLANLEPLILGREPLEHGALWERMALTVDWRHEPEPAAAAALSVLDLALWQLAALQASLPLYALLGGRYFPRCDTYVSLTPERKQASQSPPGGVRITDSSPARALQSAEELRRRWGDQIRLFLQFPEPASDFDDALRLALRAQAAETFWILDLLPVEAAAEYRDLGRQVEVPLGAGARALGLQAFRRLLTEGAVDLLGVDLRRCGGLTGARQIATFAAAEAVPVALLGGDWPVDQLLVLHLASTSGIYLPVVRPDDAPGGMPFAHENGFVTLDNGPLSPAPGSLAAYAPV